MSSFIALNIEPDDGSDEEIDDSKEIQARDPSYRKKLSFLISQGPEYYEDAAAAYKTLFSSEIFTYPESLSSFQQNTSYQDVDDDDDDLLEGVNQENDSLPTTNTNETPSSLPQILFLAYKNHGQFLLDQLRSKISRAKRSISAPLGANEVRTTVLASLRLLIEASDRDDTDLQLWRLISRLCEFLGSRRLARYCLEAALETDDGNYDLWPEPQGLDESLAAEQLQHLLASLDDSVAESEIKLLPGRKTGLVTSLKKFVDPCPFLPTPPESPGKRSLAAVLEIPAEKVDLIVPLRTWESVGKAIFHQITRQVQGLDEPAFGTAYRIVLPSYMEPGPPSAFSLRGGGSVSSATKASAKASAEHTTAATTLPKIEGSLEAQTSPDNTVKDSIPNIEQHGDDGNSAIPRRISEDYAVANTTNGLASPIEEPSRVLQMESIAPKSPENELAQPHVPQSPRVMSLPTRKRSLDVAVHPELADTGRSKSKRIKARVSIVDGVPEEAANQFEQQLQEFVQADYSLFESAGDPLSRMNANRLGTLDALRLSIAHIDQSPVDPSDVAAQDLRCLLTSWNAEKSNIFLRKTRSDDDFSGANGTRNFTAFLEDSKHGIQKPVSSISTLEDDGLDEFATEINEGWAHLDQLALAWIMALLSPYGFSHGARQNHTARYEAQKWTESLKQLVVQILVQRDEYIYSFMRDCSDKLETRLSTNKSQGISYEFDDKDQALVKEVQHIFEIHLDIYERITNPNSEVDQEIRTVQLDRLGRWNSLATGIICKRPATEEDSVLDELSIRFLWASVLYINLTDPSARDHVIVCFKDLKSTLYNSGCPVIRLHNNAAMPEVSIEAAEREISSLTTMDFFLSIFSSDNSQPLQIIESLEPMLESLGGDMNSENQDTGDPRADSMAQYLRNASLPLRLYLWQKLGSAYEAIQYLPRVLSCTLRRIKLVVDHFLSQDYSATARDTRQLDLLGWLRDLDALVTSCLAFAMKDSNAFEFTDGAQLRAAMSAMSALQRVLHVHLLWKDSVRVGQTPTFQPPRGSALSNYTASMTKFENLQIKAWMLQYMLVKEAIVQEPKLFELPSQYLLEHLNRLHDSLGLRDICGLQTKRFLKLIKTEMLEHKVKSGLYTAILKDGTSNWDRDFAQIIFDLHGIKILPSWWGLRHHGCTPDILDRDAALELMDFVVVYANRMSIKDLAKNELRTAIDKIQAAVKLPPASTDTTFNKRSINSFLKKPINPLDMYRAFRGLIDLPAISIYNESSVIASKGWYYLLGHLSLAKFRAQNRTIPGPLDDLDNATIYFRQDLELGIEKWETWYRLAQVYDVKIEEYTKWNANKLNTAMEELKTLQRNAVHCYTMAVATASRANASFEDVSKMPDLYYDFALRVYASSREPYSMRAFDLEDFERHFNNADSGMYKGQPFKALRLYAAWNFSKVLLERAVTRKSQAWASWYLLAKCLWKMYDCDDQIRGPAKRIAHSEVVQAIKRAIETIPERRDKEPILEPHYKLLSITYKLVQRNQIEVSLASEYLRITPYARKITFADEPSRWHECFMEVLKALRSADKQNWHHRMAARAAHITYDGSPDSIESARAAKEELTQQIFTKTMNIQVWRPEHERAGRHFVYTTRYVNFFVHLLIQLGDTTTLEALAKKIRKKAGDFIGHADLWDGICGQYLALLRSRGDIQQGQFDRMFKTTPLELFMLNADRLDTWVHQPGFDSPLIELIRDTIELRRLNGNLMKASAIDDLIGDTYACLYEWILPEIIAKSNDEENRVRMRVDHVLTGPEASAAETPPLDQAGNTGDVPATRGRVKGVTRREVQKRAEALVARSTAALIAASTAKVTESERVTEAGAETEPRTDAGALTGLSPRPSVAEDDGKDGASDVDGSVHDSADDESGLSEVEEFVDAPEGREEGEGDGEGNDDEGEDEEPEVQELEDDAEENDDEPTRESLAANNIGEQQDGSGDREDTVMGE